MNNKHDKGRTITVTMDDAHAFAQGLIAEGWLNDDPNCVDTLHRRLEAFAAKCNAIASMQTTTAFSCPECCAKQGQPHEPTCPTLQTPAGPAIGSWHTGLPLPGAEAEPVAPAPLANSSGPQDAAQARSVIQTALADSKGRKPDGDNEVEP